MTTIAKDKLITIFIPVRSRNMTLNITKLIAKDTANMQIAKTNCIIIKNIIPNTIKTLEIIVIILSAVG